MIVSMLNILSDAYKNKYAIPQFNINNLEWTKYILEKCEEMKSPVILGVSEGATKYMGGFNVVVNMVKGLVKDLNITIPVCIHLDHGSSVEVCKKALEAGFSSIMIDASKYEIDKNIEITNEVVIMAEKYNASVEAEIGHVGGSEDNVSAEILHASLEDCIKMNNEIKITALAPALGSVHGIYKGEPNLNFERMKEISERTKLPLVLHGGTGIYDEQIKKAIECGTCKINVNTELQISWSQGVRKYLNENKKAYDPRKIIGSGEKEIKKSIEQKVLLFGSNDRA